MGLAKSDSPGRFTPGRSPLLDRFLDLVRGVGDHNFTPHTCTTENGRNDTAPIGIVSFPDRRLFLRSVIWERDCKHFSKSCSHVTFVGGGAGCGYGRVEAELGTADRRV